MLDRSTDVGKIVLNEFFFLFFSCHKFCLVDITLAGILQKIKNRSFHPTEAKIESRYLRFRKFETVWITLLRIFVDQWSARIRQAEQLRGFIEGFARCIIDGFTNYLHLCR